MTYEQFLAIYGQRLAAYVRAFAARFGAIGRSLYRDLLQEAHLAAWQALPYWKARLDGPKNSKSAFNWCAGPMRRAMDKTLRRELGLPAHSKVRISIKKTETKNIENETRPVAASPEETLDLRRQIQLRADDPNFRRLVALTLCHTSGANLGRQENITRQAVSLSAKRARLSLRAALG